MNLPTKEECFKLLREHNLPENIIKHSEAVYTVALDIANKLERKGVKVDKDLVIAGALLHDVKRLDKDHTKSGFELLESLGLKKLAEVVRRHGLWHFGKDDFTPRTTEEKIVFYADKRVVNDKIVSVEERFDYLKKRYNMKDKAMYDYVKKIEKELGEKIVE